MTTTYETSSNHRNRLPVLDAHIRKQTRAGKKTARGVVAVGCGAVCVVRSALVAAEDASSAEKAVAAAEDASSGRAKSAEETARIDSGRERGGMREGGRAEGGGSEEEGGGEHDVCGGVVWSEVGALKCACTCVCVR